MEQLSSDRIAQIYHRFSQGGDLSEAFLKRFYAELDEEELNQSHQIVIVAAEVDLSTERIINYLSARDIAINVAFFRVFQRGDQQLLSRAWLIDPGQTQANVAVSSGAKGDKEPWNGEYYVSFGDKEWRSWEDARKYGFISAGGGSWYSQTLRLLAPGDRIWVKIPGTGYVGVGLVTGPIVAARDFKISSESGVRPALDVLKHAEQYKTYLDDEDKSEYFVPVQWLDTVSEADAINEVGLFGNQNTVCQPVTPKWRHTVDRLKEKFRHWDDILASKKRAETSQS